MTRESDIYIRFLNLARAVRDLPGLPSLDALEERVLQGLGAAWAQGQKVTVLQAMSMAHPTSPTTVHRRLKSLKRKGLILLEEDPADNRVKFVRPTAQTEAYFSKLGEAVRGAARKT